MTHIMRIDEFHNKKINENNEILDNNLMRYVNELKKKYYKYDPETYGFISGEYNGKTAWILEMDVEYDDGNVKLLIGDYTEDDARKCLKNKSLYRGHIKNISAWEWGDYNDWQDSYNYEWYESKYLELSNKKILDNLVDFSKIGVDYSYGSRDENDYRDDINIIPGYVYDNFVKKYSEVFYNVFNTELYYLGSSGKHVCIEPDDEIKRDYVLYPEMVACVEELQSRMINELEENFGK